MRLIDADELLEKIHDLYITEIGYRHRCIDVESVMDAPTVDAVPIIRCKDCKYGSPNGIYGCVLERFNRLDKSERMYSNDYCSRAEGKDDETD